MFYFNSSPVRPYRLFKIFACGIALLSTVPFYASANDDRGNYLNKGNGGTTQGDASIKIAVPVQVSQTKALNFGQVIRSNNEVGYVSVDQSGNRTGRNVVLEDNTGVSNGLFSISGERNRQVNIVVDTASTLRNENGQTLTLAIKGESSKQNLDGNGKKDYKVGGEINIAQNQASGNYTGTYNVTVSY